MSRADAARIWETWLQMWNGTPEVAHSIVAAPYRVHLPSKTAVFDVSAVNDAEAMATWVGGFIGKFDELRYETDFGPIVDGELAVARWFGTALCRGETGWPSDVPGARIHWVGVDILRIVDGWVHEAWTQGVETAAPGRGA